MDSPQVKYPVDSLGAVDPQNHVVQTQPMYPNPHTTVIVQQPQQPPPQYGPRLWSSGLFDCFDDASICLCGTFCGLCLACQVSQDMQESMCVPICLPAPVAILRTKWRTQHNIEGSILEDCLLNHFCGPCSLCQLAREVKFTKRLN